MQDTSSRQKGDLWLHFIAWFKIVKGAVLLITALGVLTLLHQDVATVIERWIRALRFDPDNKFARDLLSKLGPWDDRSLEFLSAATFAYAALFLTEGTGLLLRRRWAEYLTAIATGSFIPFELYTLIREFTIIKVLLLALNVAIVWYLIARLKRPWAFATP